MNAFKVQCTKLRKQDFTLPEIMKMTGRSKTSVYFHIKDIPLSSAKQRQIRNAHIQNARKIAARRKGKSERPFKKFQSLDTQAVLLLAHLMFDGEISRGTCGYTNRSSALIQRVQNLFRSIYTYEPRVHYNAVTGVHTIRHHNVALAAYILKQSEILQMKISDMPLESQREFVRAFFDDEGCMDVRLHKNRRKIRGYQNDREILKLIKTLLTNFSIEARLQGKNEVTITGKENLRKFQKEINFSAGVCINGNRSNSLWKISIEKRELLDRAIKSFKT